MAAARRRRNPLEEWLEPLEERLDRPEREGSSPDLVDVPAAVVCARCGDADCTGCESELSRSGIVAIVAWERPGTPMFARFWSTARATTRDAEGFFELLPDGPVMPALRFAALSELLASSVVFGAFVAVVGLIAPEWIKHVALDPASRGVALRVVLLGLPAFAALLVGAHAAHGLSIDIGASRTGAHGARSRALRFGLYACGWDFVMTPLGALIVALKEGAGAALGLSRALSGLPTRATTAFLRGCYRLEGERARRSLRASYVGASLATIAFAAIVIVAVAAAILT
jgi:hypothetical protein